MRLYLARHGEATPKNIDPQAPLNLEGTRQVGEAARLLAKNLVCFDRILHSGKTRARQTAQIFAQAAGNGIEPEQMNGLDPMDSPEPFIKEIFQWESDTLVVGHLPFMGRLVDLLLGEPGASGLVEFQTSTVTCFQKIHSRQWTLKWVLSPELFLPDT